jgi:hypothetical protein
VSHYHSYRSYRFGGGGEGAERINALVASILALAAPSAHRREGTQDDDGAKTRCNVGRKHTNEDQQPDKHNDAGQNDKAI